MSREIADVISQYKAVEFVWGKSDCCMFACDVVKATVGIDPAESYRGKYDSKEGAYNCLNEIGSIEHAFDKHFNRIDFNVAKRGDVVLHESDGDGVILSVVWSSGLVTMSRTGCKLITDNVKPIAVWRITSEK